MDEEQLIQTAMQQSIQEEAEERGVELKQLQLQQIAAELGLEKPPKPELGDWACPCFALAKVLRGAPPQLASALANKLRKLLNDWEIEVVGPYINFCVPRAAVAASVLQEISKQQQDFGCNQNLQGQKIMLEFSSPNTNKPLHLGHLRNNVLGESTSRILAANGAELNKVNIINDRGVHICKSMLAYQRFGCQEGSEGAIWDTPENSQRKGDRLVGDYYVRFNEWSKEFCEGQDESCTEDPEQLARQMLKDWENGNEDVRQLWEKMNQWVLEGIATTYQRCDISFDRLYFESETYKLGKELVSKGLERGIFQRRKDAAVFIDLAAYKLEQKVVQRSDGTSVYITQDLGTAVARHNDFPFERMIYVVGNEQDYHFKVLFQILRLLGYPWAGQLYHLSYGMVVLPDGKMKSREGSVVDADDLLDELEELALQGMREREREDAQSTEQTTARKIALAALHFYLLQFNPQREISFVPKESLAFTGNTGPYLQYVGARIHSILRKVKVAGQLDRGRLQAYRREDWQQLIGTEAGNGAEWELLKQLRDYPKAVSSAAEQLNPSHVIKALAEIARCFSRFYHEVSILHSEEPLLSLRLELCRATLQVLQNGMRLCVIPFLDSM